MTVAGELEDRSVLSAEMAELCVNLPIYIVTNDAVILNDEEADEEMVVENDMEADMEADEYIDEDANDEPEIVDTVDNPYTRKCYIVSRVTDFVIFNASNNISTRSRVG